MDHKTDYLAPPESICSFLIETLSALSIYEKLESQDLAKRLLELHGGKKSVFPSNKIWDTFPWLYQVGIIDYEFKYLDKGGNRLFMWRNAGPEDLSRILSERQDIIGGLLRPHKTRNSSNQPAGVSAVRKKKTITPTAGASDDDGAPGLHKKEKRKKCCSDPRIVKSKATGKRRCVNCGKKLKPKKSK